MADIVKKLLVMGIILLLVCVSIPSTGRVIEKQTIVSSDGNTLYVGGSGEGNYTEIQDAIDNTSDGDTVFVYNGTYYEHIIINVSINLIGEDKETTIIDGDGDDDVVYVSADWVNISGFTIQNIANAGIYLSSNYSTITGNNIVDFDFNMQMVGIYLYHSNCNTIFDNKISVVSWDHNGAVVGVSLSYSNNNVIIGNNISNNFGLMWGSGVTLYKSYNNTITGNVISNNYEGGIMLSKSTKNNISDNFIFSNGYGVRSIWSNNNTISDNNFSDNVYGICLSSSYDIDVLVNSFLNDGLFVYDSYHNNVQYNTVNGKPLIYLEDKSDKVIVEAGQVILVNCDNITVENQNVSDTTIGVELWKTYNSKICNNNCSNVRYCIYSEHSHNNNLSNNNFSNSWKGLIIYDSNGITISSNTISNRNGCGIFIKESSDNTICSNKISAKLYGISLQYCSSNTITNNNINLDNDHKTTVLDGVYLFSTDDNIITNNKIDLNGSLGTGILTTHSDNNFISSNIISNIGYEGNNYGWGIKSHNSDSNIITSNYITKSWRGISIDSNSIENIIIANYITANRGDGIHFEQSSDNKILDNNLKFNEFGISLYRLSHNNTIYHNNFMNNTQNAYDECNNTWDDGYPSGGNYWDDYNGSDDDGDGIGDTPYPIPGGYNEDRYPLMEPYGNQPPSVEIINPEEGYFHFSGIPLLPTPLNLIADTMSLGGFRLRPIIINATDDIDKSEDLIVNIYLDGEYQGNASYCCDWRKHEWFWTGWAFGNYILKITAEDSYGKIGVAEMKIWNFCLLP